MKQIIISALLIVTALILAVPTVAFASTTTDENGFSQGYNLGLEQGQVAHQAKVFHIGNIACIGQTLAYCDGYIAGYLDGFFSTIPTNTITHNTTTRITVHEEHHQKDRGCHHDNMTSTCDSHVDKKPVKTTTPPPSTNSTK